MASPRSNGTPDTYMKPNRHSSLCRNTVVAMVLAGIAPLWASSHSDAPLIKQDPQANLTDVYAFVGTRYDNPDQRVLNVLVSVRPFSDPGDGLIYERFADDALYSLHITHPTSGETLIRYDFQFSAVDPVALPGLKNPDTILSYGVGTEVGPILSLGDARQNYTQTYTVRRNKTSLGTATVPPPNVGNRTTPLYNDAEGRAVSGAVSFGELDAYTQEAIRTFESGEVVFAGLRDDGFYADTPAIFDLLDPRILDNNGEGVDGFKGYNVLTYGIQIPLESLPSFEFDAPFADLANALPAIGKATGVGVYASVSRPRVTLRRTDARPQSSGPWIQVNRLGNPLFNEVLVALRDKDRYNRTSPTSDAALVAQYARQPELVGLIQFAFGVEFVGENRADLEAVFIPDVLRVDTTTPPVRLAGESGFSRFGFVGGDTVTDADGRVKSAGWPNGRRVGDDVVDIALTAVASGPTYSTVTVVGDNVAANDQLYHQVFPYLATPHAGPTVRQRQSP